MTRKNHAAILFDFDGTLVDSIGATTLATNSVLASHGHATVSHQDILAGMRYPTPERFGFHTGERTAAALEGMSEDYYAALVQHADAIEPIDGLVKFIEGLRAQGLKSGIISNNRGSTIRSILARWRVDYLFDLVIGDGDGYPAKPNPEVMAAACERLAIPARRAAYIGDGDVDAETAQAAGVYSIGVGWVHARHGLEPSREFSRLAMTVDELEEFIEGWLSEV